MSVDKYSDIALSYEDYEGVVDGCENGLFWGHIEGLSEPEYFHAERMEELESAFQAAVREHIFVRQRKALWDICEP